MADPTCATCGRTTEPVPDGLRNEARLFGHRFWCPACGQAVCAFRVTTASAEEDIERAKRLSAGIEKHDARIREEEREAIAALVDDARAGYLSQLADVHSLAAAIRARKP